MYRYDENNYNVIRDLSPNYFCRYGGRATTEHCTVAIIVMSLQSITGVVIQVIKLLLIATL